MATRPAFLFWLAGALLGAAGLAAAADPAGEIVSLEGKGEAREAQQVTWSSARVKQRVYPTNFVRTLDLSRMGLLLADGTQVRLAPNSLLQVKESAKGTDAKTILNLNAGRSWVQSKTAPRGLVVETPSAVAAIRGTDWELVVEPDGRTTLSVLSGEVDFGNAQGGLVVKRGEQARAEVGKAPVKLQVTVSRERVQWVSSVTADPDRYAGTRGLALAPAYEKLLAEAASGRALQAEAWLLLADFEAYRGDTGAASRVLAAARAQHPADARLDAALARLAMLEGEGGRALALAREATARSARSLEAWLALGEAARLEGLGDESARAYERAIDLAAGDARGWLGLGVVEAERDRLRAAREKLARAAALDPANATIAAESGTLAAQSGDLAAARESFQRALERQPENFVAWTGLGIVELRGGQREAAREALQKATLIEPRYGRAYAWLAAAYYQDGRRDAAADMLRRAAEVDPKDPLPHMLAAQVKLDAIDPVAAAGEAREALARLPFLKSLDAVADNQKGVANVGASLAFMGLEAWAMSAAQDSWLPSWGGSHLFAADRYPGEFNRRSELMQGFVTDPLAFGASNRFQSLVSAPGHHATASVRYNRSNAVSLVEPVISANGLVTDPVPIAYFAEGVDTRIDPRGSEFEARAKTYTVALGARPSHEVSLFLYANRLEADVFDGPREGTGLLRHIEGTVSRLDVGARLIPADGQSLWFKAGTGREDTRNDELTTVLLPNQNLTRVSAFATQPQGHDVAFKHAVRLAQGADFAWGAEYARVASPRRLQQDATIHFVSLPSPQQSLDQSDADRSVAVHALARASLGAVTVEGGLAWRDYRKDRDAFVSSGQVASQLEDDFRRKGTDPFAGVVWKPATGHTGRAACRRWLRPASLDTFQPVAIAGIPAEDQLVFAGGELRQCRLQWEWAISPASFLEAHAEEVRVENLVSSLDGVQNTRADVTNLDRLRNRVLTPPTRPDALEDVPVFGQGRVRRAKFAYERTMGRALAMRLHYEYADSRNTDPFFEGRKVPWIPRQRADVGFTWAPGWQTFVTVAGAWRAARFADEANAVPVPAGWDARVNVYVESADKRWAIEAYGFNLLKKEVGDAFGVVASWRF